MSKSILIVDDEQIIRSILQRKLEQTTDYKVFTADDGLPALEIFRREKIDLVISDLLMTEMDGIELLRNLKKLAPNVPVIIITGYGTLDSAIEAIHLGAEDFIKKPFDISAVIETIERTFNRFEEQVDQRAVLKCIEMEKIEFLLPTDLDRINMVINFIASHIRARWEDGDTHLHDIKISLYEAMVNAFEHGNLGISGEEKDHHLSISQQDWKEFLHQRLSAEKNLDKRIRVRLALTGQYVEVSVFDEGDGFDYINHLATIDPQKQFRSSGRGLLIISSLMDEIEFRHDGAEIIMRKHR